MESTLEARETLFALLFISLFFSCALHLPRCAKEWPTVPPLDSLIHLLQHNQGHVHKTRLPNGDWSIPQSINMTRKIDTTVVEEARGHGFGLRQLLKEG